MRTSSATATDFVSGRRGAVFSGLAFLLLVGVLGPVVPARAAVTHVLDSSFETKYESAPATFSPVSPRTIAVDESSGSVYVISESPARITKYDADGNPSNFSALGSNTINFSEPFAQPREIAVDNSGGLNSGDIYVGRSGFSTGSSALVFLPSGSFVAAINNSSGAVADGPFCGAATNTSGDLFLSHPNALLQGPYIDKYHPGQWLANANPPQQWPIAGTMVGIPSETCKLAVDSENSIYVNNSYITGSGNLLKYASTVFDLEEPPSRTIDSGSTYVSIDTSTDDAYSDRDNSIARFDSMGTSGKSSALEISNSLPASRSTAQPVPHMSRFCRLKERRGTKSRSTRPPSRRTSRTSLHPPARRMRRSRLTSAQPGPGT